MALQAEDEYMISDYDLFVNKYISVPKDLGQLNCSAFVAGIVKGVLDGAGFPARYRVVYSRTSSVALEFMNPEGCGSAAWLYCLGKLLHAPLQIGRTGDFDLLQGHRALCTCQGTGQAQDNHSHEI